MNKKVQTFHSCTEPGRNQPEGVYSQHEQQQDRNNARLKGMEIENTKIENAKQLVQNRNSKIYKQTHYKILILKSVICPGG